MTDKNRIVIIGAGIAGLTTGALLAKNGYDVTVLEAQTYPGGCASTYFHKGYRFDSGATVAGGFQPNGPHALVGEALNLEWPVHAYDPAWVVHMPGHEIALTKDNRSVIENFPESERFWEQQSLIADLGWSLSAQGLPWPPTDIAEFAQLAKVGIRNLPGILRIIPFALGNTHQWMRTHGLHNNQAFTRFIDGQLLISAQTTSRHAYALYSATALDLARQGVYHAEGGIGGIAEALVQKIESYGGRVEYRQHVTRIPVDQHQVTGVYAKKGRRSKSETFFPADFVVGNLEPWSLDKLLGDHSPQRLQREVASRKSGWSAFVLHLGVREDGLPDGLADHHQILTDLDGSLGEGRSIFISLSPAWDASRAPEGERAVTITTHTNVQPWWSLLEADEAAYHERKAEYAEMILNRIDRFIPGFKSSVTMMLPGSPVTYQFYTGRHLGMVGGFPQTSLFNARGPRTGIRNLRLVGDSIFPGQSTAGVSLGAMRVADDIKRHMPARSKHTVERELTEPTRS